MNNVPFIPRNRAGRKIHDLARRQERLERSRRRGHENPSSWDRASASMRVTRKP